VLPMTIEPHRSLLTYYLLDHSLILGPFFIFGMAYGYFRFRTRFATTSMSRA
jgi:hypothetical protein